jgi:hypothetical protein
MIKMTAVAHGEPIPAERLAPLQDHSGLLGEPERLREQLAAGGYLYLPGFFARADVLAARADIFRRLAEVGEIQEPVIEGIYTGASQRRERVADLGQFWKSLSETWSLRRLSHGRALHELMDQALGGPARAQDYLFLRPANRGKFTYIHCDYPFFTRTTEAVATAWIALGDVPTEDGPLFLLENSHRFQDIADSYRGFDVARDTSRKAALMVSPIQFAAERKTRILAQDFSAGDVVIFQMFLLHGSLDNVSPQNRVRLSCDVRYQLASAPLDPRYFGPDPSGTTGIGYGELVGAKPLTDAWHIR